MTDAEKEAKQRELREATRQALIAALLENNRLAAELIRAKKRIAELERGKK
jgi:hypothetical protein